MLSLHSNLPHLIRFDANGRRFFHSGDDRRKSSKFELIEGRCSEAVEARESMHELQVRFNSCSCRPANSIFCCMTRFLKIKCDGVKPICGPCRRHPKDDECEYSDGPGRSRTKVLEDTVSRLEARLHELEHPETSTPSVTLHDPYGQYHETQRLSKSPPLFIPDSLPLNPLSPFSPTSTSSSLPSGRHWRNFAALEAMTESIGSSGSSKSPLRRHNASPFLGTDNLLDKFLPHSAHFGFFLHIPTFRDSAIVDAPFGDHSRPSPALLSAVYLWGVHFSRSEALLLQEHAFLTRALQHTATDLLGNHPQKVIHTLQAEVLLAFYFFRTGRFLEAKSHTGSAVSIALGSHLHKVRSSVLSAPSTIGLVSGLPLSLHSPRDNLEEGERINGFWAVFLLHKLIAVALEPPANVCGALEAPGIQIDTPWPLDINSYMEGPPSPDVRGHSTVRNFLGTYPVDHHNGDSMTALVVKASILFHRAAHLTGQWTPNMPQREFQAFAAAFQSINRLIDGFRIHLPPISQFESSDPVIRTVVLTHALVDAATIKLHSIFAYADSASKQNCLAAARNMLNFEGRNLQELGYMNPIMGSLWMTACHVFIDEISRVRLLQDSWQPSSGVHNAGEEELMESLRSGLTALSYFSEDSALMNYQLNKVHEAFSAI
ncbi:hypothetical protein BDQ12DRAFT_603499 [Crucibulum laeve]|uniref:Xylanolytic transcriptional activator regulatory domain-containing protein n=1 Tax=Crucibulum laeve TaxID=68775 RepID=A0A5C3M629_9AGAR|nr:hypothetical protein BDQ12DRAFT_603499 [Crucibulum laeve]